MATSGKDFRLESDLIGERQISNEHLYGVQTLRGIENFNISNFHLCDYPLFIHGLAWTKEAAAIANHRLGLLTDQQKDAIVQACHELLEGKHHQHFPVDMIQGGAGTTTNMNANEVICNRALEIMGHEKGEFKYLSPNDHVNGSQSTNDAYPTAIHLGLYASHLKLRPHFIQLIEALEKKSKEFAHVVKMGRTQLQDAVPMTLGQTFGGFASILRHEIANLDYAAHQFLAINMGATAIGTGISSEPEYAGYCTEAMAKITGWDITLTEDLVGATSDTSERVGYSSALRRIAIKVNKICNDLRLLSSGPRCGLGEITIPSNEPGSSIMPGKVNPTQCESATMVAVQVMANDAAVAIAASQGNFELNVYMPVTIYNFLQSVRLLADSLRSFDERCVAGIKANKEKMHENLHRSLMLVTALNPVIGYEKAAKTAHKAYEENISLKEACVALGFLTPEKFDEVFHPEEMV